MPTPTIAGQRRSRPPDWVSNAGCCCEHRTRRIHRRRREYEEAVPPFEQAVKIDPVSFEYAFDLAQTYRLLNRHSDAVRAYLHACDLNPAGLQVEHERFAVGRQAIRRLDLCHEVVGRGILTLVAPPG